jgi:hypothetical protein
MRILGVAGLVLCALSVGGCRGNAEMAELDPITLVRASLRAVASAQEAYWKEHHTYASSVEILEEFPGCKIQEGVSVRIVDASEHGFAAEATHPEFAGRSCVQWYGRGQARGRKSRAGSL